MPGLIDRLMSARVLHFTGTQTVTANIYNLCCMLSCVVVSSEATSIVPCALFAAPTCSHRCTAWSCKHRIYTCASEAIPERRRAQLDEHASRHVQPPLRRCRVVMCSHLVRRRVHCCMARMRRLVCRGTILVLRRIVGVHLRMPLGATLSQSLEPDCRLVLSRHTIARIPTVARSQSAPLLELCPLGATLPRFRCADIAPRWREGGWWRIIRSDTGRPHSERQE